MSTLTIAPANPPTLALPLPPGQPMMGHTPFFPGARRARVSPGRPDASNRLRRPSLRRLDSYIFRQILGPFLFFVLVFTGVIWLGQSLRIIDTVVNNGQSAMVFLEFTLLLLPTVLSIVLPVATFAATLYALNRLFADSEIVVMLASGLSGMSLLRPVLGFSSLVMVVVFGLTLYAMPTSQRELKSRINEVKGDVATVFLREGAFQSPVRGVTVYLRGMDRSGEMLGIFIHDERDNDQITTYTAERAVLFNDPDGTRLVMFNGVVQIAKRHEADSVAILRFEQFAYDLTQFTSGDIDRVRKPSELYLPELMTITEDETGGRRLGKYRAEAHETLSAPLYVLTLPLLAVVFVIGTGFRPEGFLGRIFLAAGIAVGLRILGLAMKAATSNEIYLWPLMYAPPILGIVSALWLLAGWPVPWRRRRPMAGTGEITSREAAE
jgi:lipopolysaccharide export system permease protein